MDLFVFDRFLSYPVSPEGAMQITQGPSFHLLLCAVIKNVLELVLETMFWLTHLSHGLVVELGHLLIEHLPLSLLDCI